MPFVPELEWWEVVTRLCLAGGLGAAIGFERELREREAGLRTHLLVALGSALFTLVSAYAWQDFRFSGLTGVTFDPTRIAAQIVTGIGFLGAGAIIRQGLTVRGLTTAATLWGVAAIGMACGAGYYLAAVVTTMLVIFTLWPLRTGVYHLVERVRPEERRLTVELRPEASAGILLAAVEAFGGRVQSLDVDEERERRRVMLEVDLGRKLRAEALVAELSELDEVTAVRWRR